MNRPESALLLHRRRMTLIKNIFILLITLALLAALITSFITNKTPWRLDRNSPSVVAESHLNLRWIDEVLLPSGLGTIDDNGTITSWIHTKTSGTVLSIAADQTTTSSASIILKDYSMFVYADQTHQIWLHRGQKTLQAYSETSNILWEQRFPTWTEYAWASDDGYVLVLSLINETDWKVSLISNQGTLLWEHETLQRLITGAKIAPQGKGVLLTTRTQQAPYTTEFLLLNENGLVLDSINVPSTALHSSALHTDGLSAVVSTDQDLYFLKDPKQQTISTSSLLPTTSPSTTTPTTETVPTAPSGAKLTLPAPITSLVMAEKTNSVVAACWDDVNKSGWLVYIDKNNQIMWSEPLLEKPLLLGVHPSGFAIYGGGNSQLFTYTNQGAVIWKHIVTEKNLIDLVFSPSGEFIAGLDSNGKLILWQVP